MNSVFRVIFGFWIGWFIAEGQWAVAGSLVALLAVHTLATKEPQS